MTIIINEETVLELLPKAVELRGTDYVYDDLNSGQCDYVRDGGPSCIVGQVFALAGVPLETLEKMDDTDQIALRDWSLDGGIMNGYAGYRVGGTNLEMIASAGLLEHYGIEVAPLALKALFVAQEKQDRGKPWGVAAGMAVMVIETNGGRQ